MFDPIAYFEYINDNLNLTKGKFKFTKVSGVGYLEDVLLNAKRQKYFLAVDINQDGYKFEGGGSGIFDKRFHTVFILAKVINKNKMDEKDEKLDECRAVYDKIIAKMNYDRVNDNDNLRFLDMTRLRYNEFPGFLSLGFTGLIFNFTVDDCEDLIYNPDDYA